MDPRQENLAANDDLLHEAHPPETRSTSAQNTTQVSSLEEQYIGDEYSASAHLQISTPPTFLSSNILHVDGIDPFEGHVLAEFYTQVTSLRPLYRKPDVFANQARNTAGTSTQALPTDENVDAHKEYKQLFAEFINPDAYIGSPDHQDSEDEDPSLWPAPLFSGGKGKEKDDGDGHVTTTKWCPGRTDSEIYPDKEEEWDSEEAEAAMVIASSDFYYNDTEVSEHDFEAAELRWGRGKGKGKRGERISEVTGYPFLDAEIRRRSLYQRTRGLDPGPACLGSAARFRKGENLDHEEEDNDAEDDEGGSSDSAREHAEYEAEHRDPVLLEPKNCRLIEREYHKIFETESITLDTPYKHLIYTLYATIQVQRARAKFIKNRERETTDTGDHDLGLNASKESQGSPTNCARNGEGATREENILDSLGDLTLGDESDAGRVPPGSSTDIDIPPLQQPSEPLVADLAGRIYAPSQRSGRTIFDLLSRPWSTLTVGGTGPWSGRSERRLRESRESS